MMPLREYIIDIHYGAGAAYERGWLRRKKKSFFGMLVKH